MNSETIVIVDYGLGNLYSVQRAFEHCGAGNVIVSSSIDDICSADKLVLPGVGAFGDGMRGLNQLELAEPIKKHAVNNKPLLGICLGMQLFATTSEEFGNHQGLNLIPGRVLPIPAKSSDGTRRKVPFIGWSSLSISNDSHTKEQIMHEVDSNMAVYLVHSYHFVPDQQSNRWATYNFQGEQVTAAVKSNKIYGLQFHPEKSGPVGLKIISNFISS